MTRRGPARAALALAGLAAGLCGAEWFCRERLPPPVAPSETYLRFLLENAEPYFRLENTGGRETLVQSPTVFKAVLSQRLPRLKPRGVKRVLVIGESSADMLSREMRGLLQDEPSTPLEVVDCAVGAGSLEQVRNRFDECVQYSPDAVVLAFGHNLFYDHRESPSWLLRLRLRARASRLVSGLLERVLWRPTPAPYDPERRLLQLREFIHYVGCRCRSKGIPGVLVPLASNLWFAPVATEAERTAPEYLGAVYLYRSGRRREAADSLARAVRRRSSALWRFTLGDWHHRLGDEAEALRELLLARDLDPARRRASSDVNGTLRAAAAAEGLVLFDGERWVVRRAPGGIPGWESFEDNQHVSEAIFRRWAGECLVLLSRHGLPDPGAGVGGAARARESAVSPESALQSTWSMAGASPDAQSSVIYLAEQRLGPSERIDERALSAIEPDPSQRALIRFFLAEAAWRSGRRAAALEMNGLLRRREPRWADADVQRGLFELESGRLEAAASSFREALRESPGRKDAEFYLRAVASGRALDTRLGAVPILRHQ